MVSIVVAAAAGAGAASRNQQSVTGSRRYIEYQHCRDYTQTSEAQCWAQYQTGLQQDDWHNDCLAFSAIGLLVLIAIVAVCAIFWPERKDANKVDAEYKISKDWLNKFRK